MAGTDIESESDEQASGEPLPPQDPLELVAHGAGDAITAGMNSSAIPENPPKRVSERGCCKTWTLDSGLDWIGLDWTRPD